MKSSRVNMWLILAVVVLAAAPLVLISGKDKNGQERFQGSDDQGTNMITQIRPDYKPWFKSLWEPPSPEVESLLFALQAAIGAGVIGYYFGLKRGQAQGAQAANHASD